MSSNPYPFYDDSWNRILLMLAGGNVLALLMWLTLGERVALSQLSETAWVPGVGGTALFFFYVACLTGAVILWGSMWTYWARTGRPLLWLFLLLFGPWGTSIAFLLLVYRKDLEAFQRETELEADSCLDAERIYTRKTAKRSSPGNHRKRNRRKR